MGLFRYNRSTCLLGGCHEPNEPPHVHVDRDDQSAKFWIGPVALARNLGFRANELRKIERVLTEHEQRLLEAWYGYFGY
jgi:hypothetical protein